jgi:signal transduction histidine kinase
MERIAIAPGLATTDRVQGRARQHAIRRRGFDVDRLLERAVVYGILALAIAGTWTIGVAVLGQVEQSWLAGPGAALRVAFIVLIAAGFAPARARIQHAVDRLLARGRLDYRRTQGAVRAGLSSVLHVDDILDRVGRTLGQGFQLWSFVVILRPDTGTELWRFDVESARMERAPAASYAALFRRLSEEPYRGWLVPEEDDGTREHREATALDAVLLVPLPLAGRVVGAFVLGPKRSGRDFDREELGLLGMLAAQTAVALENARSFEALETKVRERTAELERSNAELARAYREVRAAQAQLVHSENMASLGVVVAGVAHEINNPVSFIVGNIEPVQELVADIRADVARYADPGLEQRLDDLSTMMDVVARGAERTAGVVNDLRAFSRVGEEQPRPVDLHEGMEVSLRLLRPRWEGRITVHREYGPVPPVESVPGHLNQLFMNLLSNACDAIDGRGNIWLRTVADGDLVRVLVRDDGAGIPQELLSRVFEPFFTSKPQGKGTGLGLAIAHGVVMRMGGTIEVASAPGHGAAFIVVLPLRQRPLPGRPAPR